MQIFGVVKFVAAILCALFLVDLIGRKRSLSIGIACQAISMAYVAAFLTAVPGIESEGFEFTKSQKMASTGALVMIYISGFGWAMGWNSMQYRQSNIPVITSSFENFANCTFT